MTCIFQMDNFENEIKRKLCGMEFTWTFNINKIVSLHCTHTKSKDIKRKAFIKI